MQTSAEEIDPALLKARFGERVTFWGGIDTRPILNHGTAEDVSGRKCAKLSERWRREADMS